MTANITSQSIREKQFFNISSPLHKPWSLQMMLEATMSATSWMHHKLVLLKTLTLLNNQRGLRLIEAVIQNNVTTLRKLLTRKWYKVSDKDGNNLLQIAIIKNNKEVFDYILSLPDFPTEHCNKEGKTALIIALTAFVDNDFNNTEVEEYFGVQLLKKGALWHPMALHHAAYRNFIEVAKLLLEKGADPNFKCQYGSTALHGSLDNYVMGFEFEALLLSYGVDPLIEDNDGYTSFELALNHPGKSQFVESLCNYTVDEHSQLKVHLSVLLKLAQLQSPVLHVVVDQVVQVVIDELAMLDFYLLFFINEEYLRILAQRCGFLMIYIVMASKRIESLIPFTISTRTTINSLGTFVEDTFKCDIVDFITTLNSNTLFGSLTETRINESTLIELTTYLLMNGLNLNELDLQMIFEKYGYCDLFKMLLHMDFEIGVCNRYAFGRSVIPVQESILPIFIYNIHLDLETYLKNPEKYSLNNVEQLLSYFIHPKLTELCNSQSDEENVRRSVPQVPRLLQLSRDVFRKFIVVKFGFKTVQMFYSYVNCLPVNSVYKKIITFEKKLYSGTSVIIAISKQSYKL